MPIRGNLDTRLRKLDDGLAPDGFDAIVLAAAGLRRLGMASRISATLPPSACVPAPGQGIVAIEIREHDATSRRGGAGDRRAAGPRGARCGTCGRRSAGRRMPDADWSAGLAALER